MANKVVISEGVITFSYKMIEILLLHLFLYFILIYSTACSPVHRLLNAACTAADNIFALELIPIQFSFSHLNEQTTSIPT